MSSLALPLLEEEVKFTLPGTQKLGYLDGLRGLACMVVVTDHWFSMGFQQPQSAVTSAFWQPWLYHTPLRVLVAGEFAVAIFFVLSGYVLLIKFFKTPTSRKILLESFLRRWPRLWLPTSFSALVYYAWLHLGPFGGSLGCHAVGEGDPLTIYSPTDMLVNVSVGMWFWQPSIYSIQWTLQVELLYSFVAYSVALGVSMLPKVWLQDLCYVFPIVLLPIINFWVAVPRWLQYLIPFSFGGLFCLWDYSPVFSCEGARFGRGGLEAIRRLAKRPRIFYPLQMFMLCVALYLGSLPVFVILGPDNTGTLWAPLGVIFGWWWLSIAAALIVCIALTLPLAQSLLSCSLVHLLGTISFAVYLFHYQVLIFADIVVCPLLIRYWGFSRDATVVFTFFVVVLPLTIVCAYIATVMIDSRAMTFANSVAHLVLGNESNYNNNTSSSLRPSLKSRDYYYALLERIEITLKSQTLWFWISIYLFLIAMCYIPRDVVTPTC